MANNSRFTQIYKGSGSSRRERPREEVRSSEADLQAAGARHQTAGAHQVTDARQQPADTQQVSGARQQTAGTQQVTGARQQMAGTQQVTGARQQMAGTQQVTGARQQMEGMQQVTGARQQMEGMQQASSRRPVRISTDLLPEVDGGMSAPPRTNAGGNTAVPRRADTGSNTAVPKRPGNGSGTAVPKRPVNGSGTAVPGRAGNGSGTAAPGRANTGGSGTAVPRRAGNDSSTAAPGRANTGGSAAAGTRRPPVSSRNTGRPPVIPPEQPGAGGAYPGSRPARRRGGVRHVLFRIFQVLLALFVAGTLSCAAIGLYYVHTVIKKAPAVSDVTVSPGSAATYIYSQSGKREQKLTLPEANRDLVTILNVPIDLQHAFVAVEDARFYQHNGIDPKGIIRAFWHGVTTGRFDEGASTITQQLLKNTVFTSWTTEKSFLDRLDRKIQEQYLAIQLEKVMTKDQIMEDYLNVINLGAGCYGVQSAAFRYFGKDVSELTLSECAVIAGITQNPTFYNPITYPDNNNGKRRAVLNLMLAQGYITEAQRDEALADPVYERIQSNEDTKASEVSVYTYYQDALIDQVIEDLMNERGFTYKQAVKAVYAGGLRIYSAQDPSIQQICDEEFANPSNFPEGTEAGIDYALSIESSSGEVTHYGNEDLISYMRKTADPRFNLMLSTDAQARECADAFKASVLKEGDTVLGERVTITPQPQASVTIIDPETGYVRALVGGRGTKEASLTLNRASYTTRQPGSTFKILTTYAPAIDSCSKTLASVYDNTAYTYEDGTPVNNWDLQTTSGPVTIRQAIAESINIVAVRCITEITPRLGFSYAKAMGISSLVENYNNGSEVLTDVTQSLALGGITLGVTNLELCSAYACIANSGMYIAPKFYTKVLDTYGNTILDNTAPASQAVLKSSTAALLTSAMEDVIADPSGTAYGSISLKDMPVAGKSGTTSDYRDIWFAGFTPYYACCVWGGYDNNAALPDSGLYHSYNKVLWNSIMNRIHEGLAPRSFYVPSDVVSAEICDTTGMAATTGCPAHHSELFSTDTQPMYYCNAHGNGGIVSGIVLPQSAFTDTNGQGNDIVIIQDGSNTWTFTPGESTVIDTGNTLVPDGSSSENALFPDNSPSGNTLVPDDSSLSPEVIEILNGIPEPH